MECLRVPLNWPKSPATGPGKYGKKWRFVQKREMEALPFPPTREEMPTHPAGAPGSAQSTVVKVCSSRTVKLRDSWMGTDAVGDVNSPQHTMLCGLEGWAKALSLLGRGLSQAVNTPAPRSSQPFVSCAMV